MTIYAIYEFVSSLSPSFEGLICPNEMFLP